LSPGELLRTKLERLLAQVEVARARLPPTDEREVSEAIVQVMAELGEHRRTAEHAFMLARVLATLAEQGGTSMDEALRAAEEAVRGSLGRDPAHLALLARINQTAGRTGAAIDALEQAMEVYDQMFGDARHPDWDRAEGGLIQLYYQDRRWQRLVALCDKRVERVAVSRMDLLYAAALHVQPTGKMKRTYDPQKAREYALRATRIGLTPLPEAKLVLSFAHYRCDDLELSLQVAREALDEQRTLEGEQEKLADGGAEIAGFFSKLAFLLELEPWREKGPRSKWRAAWLEMLTREERARVTR